jgi:hypothetical protein
VITVDANEDQIDGVAEALGRVGATDISVLREHGDRPRTVARRHDDD